MKYLQRLLFLFATSIAIFSCQKEYSVENNPGGSGSTSQWSFSEGSAQFKGAIDTVQIDTLGQYTFVTLNGHSADNKDQITLQVFGSSVKAGTYKTPVSLFAYMHNGVVMYETNQTAVDSFTIVITKIDSTIITGTFSGKAYDTAKNYKTIVDGKFTAVIKSNSTVTPPVTSGGGDYFPTTKNSNWSYLWEGGTAADTLYTLSTGQTATFSGKQYSLFTNDDGNSKDTSYYGKSNGVYYTYVPHFLDTLHGIDVPGYSYDFLKDNIAQSATYTEGPFTATSSGVPVNSYMTMTILEINPTLHIGSQTYDVIKVRSVFSVKVGTVSQDAYALEQWYAKGIGLIKYIEFSDPTSTTPTDVLDLTRATIY